MNFRLRFVLVIAIASAWSAVGNAQEKTYKILTTDRGSATFDMSTAMHRVLHDNANISLQQMPQTGLSKFLPKFDAHEAEFLVANSVDLALAYQGPENLKIGGKNPFQQSKNLRLVTRGPVLLSGFFVRKDSKVKNLIDIKGQPIAGEFPEHIAIWFNVYGYLANVGLTWNDVKVVPVQNSNDGVKALIEKKVEATSYALNAPKIKDADNMVGVRHVSLDCSSEGLARVRKAVPGYTGVKVSKGTAVGIVEDTCVLAYDLYVIAHKDVDPAIVASVTKGLYENVDKLQTAAPIMKTWTQARAASADITVPYHQGAIDYYKSKGLWTAEMEEAQKKLLAAHK